MYKIMIVEDDLVIAKTLSSYLQTWGYESVYVEDFKDVLPSFISFSPQLVLLDISLPFFNGYHWCTQIRKVSKVPIIFISSSSDNMNIVMAMNMGGDDFIKKPFDLNVVTAKIQAMLRRTYDFSSQTSLLEYKGAILNINDASLTYQDKKLELAKNDFKILQVLLENKEKLVSRDLLMKRLWETDDFIDENTLTVNIARLRKKLESVGLADIIKTKKGIGYMLE